jgi:hypothetical protein
MSAPEEPASYTPHSKLQFFLPSHTTLYTPTGKPLPCTIDTCSSRSFITSSTLNSYLPTLQIHPCQPPIKTIKDNKPTMYVSLPFSLIDSAGERVDFKTDVQIMDGVGADRKMELDGKVLLGVDFLEAKGLSKVRDEEEGVGYLVGGGIGGRKIPLERVRGDEERRMGLRYNGKVACASCERHDRGFSK